MIELNGFENREDDWLAKERKREARHSAWDLDDAKKLKEEHELIHSQEIKRNLTKKKYINKDNPVYAIFGGLISLIFIIFFIFFFSTILRLIVGF